MLPLDLAFREEGRGDPIIIMHGLFGAGQNWASHARLLADEYRVILPDLRNHGASPWSSSMSYLEMAEDIERLMEKLALSKATIVGHSMGGKVAMALALTRHEKVSRLAVVDISPVTYPLSLGAYAQAMADLDLENLASRAAADEGLAPVVEDQSVRAFLLQNLQRDGDAWRWRLNLAALLEDMGSIGGFPSELEALQYEGPTTFIAGGRSDHMTAEHRPAIMRYFPGARARIIPTAGHWVHAEEPEAFMRALNAFLSGQ